MSLHHRSSPDGIVLFAVASEKRYDIDLVHDDVQKDLIMEISALQGAIALLTRTMEQTKEQLR